MERKSIGSFIAALRKANGMTQKQLAEKLGVSDKAVSRWERDECAPDLTLIPVLAEIFGVTSDEILRGERQNPDTVPAPSAEIKTEKQIKNILGSIKTRFALRSLISAGIILAGVITLLLCNFAFLRGEIGFYLGAILFAAGIICEIGFLISAFASLKSDEADKLSVFDCRYSILKIATLVIAAAVCMFIASIPFASCSYYGLTDLSGCVAYFLVSAIVCAVLCPLVLLAYKASVLKKFDDPESAKQLAYVKKTQKHAKKTVLSALALLAATFAGQHIFNTTVGPSSFAEGKTFTNTKDFIAYMETPADSSGEGTTVWTYETETASEEIEDDYIEPAENIDYITDEKGNNIYYTCKNESVVQIDTEFRDGKFRSVRCYTDEDIMRGSAVIDKINVGFVALYFVEILFAVLYYIRGKKRLKN